MKLNIFCFHLLVLSHFFLSSSASSIHKEVEIEASSNFSYQSLIIAKSVKHSVAEQLILTSRTNLELFFEFILSKIKDDRRISSAEGRFIQVFLEKLHPRVQKILHSAIL